MSLDTLFPAKQADWLRSLAINKWFQAEDVNRTLADWSASGAVIEHLGYSRAGSEIKAAVIGSGEKTLVAWGFPHPDEPIGATALAAFGAALLAGELVLDDWQLVIILCADPDNANGQDWVADGSASSYSRSVWRPLNLDNDVDYGFPVRHRQWRQEIDAVGRCASLGDCQWGCEAVSDCQMAEELPGPLPESLAVRQALLRYQPQLVATMHNTHTAGDYTYLLQRPRAEVLTDLALIPGACGSGRHLGEKLDPGRRWQTAEPDLLRDFGLAWSLSLLRSLPDYHERAVYSMNASVGLFLDAELPGTQLLTPETALFRNAHFSDSSECQEQVELQISYEQGAKGLYEVRRYEQDGNWLVADRQPYSGRRRRSHTLLTTVPRSVLGLRALLRRRESYQRQKQAWLALGSLVELEHPFFLDYMREQRPFKSGARLLFQTDKRFRASATVAQQASFTQIWRMDNVTVLARMYRFLNSISDPRAERARAILDREQDQLLLEADVHAADKSVSVRSQLARVLRLMNEY